MIRRACQLTTKPIYVIETGIATGDDRRRIDWIDATLAEIARCRAEGIDVRSYFYWSLLDNCEWSSGYALHSGLASLDRIIFRRALKPSAQHLAARTRAGRFQPAPPTWNGGISHLLAPCPIRVRALEWAADANHLKT